MNHLGTAALTRLLLPALRRAPRARIVVLVTSDSVLKAPKAADTDDIVGQRFSKSDMEAYGNSKWLIFSYLRHLAATALKGSNIDVACVAPGAVNTGIQGKMQCCIGCLMSCAINLIGHSLQAGALMVTYAVASPEPAGRGFFAVEPNNGFKGKPREWVYTAKSPVKDDSRDARVMAATDALLAKRLGPGVLASE